MTDHQEPGNSGITWILRLYVAGQTPRSVRAARNLRGICEAYLAGSYRIEVVDLVDHPSRAREDEIVAIPTLVRRLPEPVRRVIGDLGDTERVLVGLEIRTADRECGGRPR